MKKSIKISLLFVFLSFIIHFYLSQQHYNLKYGFEAVQSLCTLSNTFNCEAVTLSPYSYLMNIPLSVWGTAFHVVFLAILLLIFLYPENKSYKTISFLYATISAIASLVMLVISLTLMDTYCLFCIALYLLAFLNFAFYLVLEKSEKNFDLKNLSQKTLGVSLLVVLGLSFLGHDMAVKSYGTSLGPIIQDSYGQWERSNTYDFQTPLLKIGPEDAKFKIVEFADFQCIHCKNAASKLKAFALSKKDISFAFFSFPLDGRCNPGAQPRDGKSCLMAKAVFCAEKENKGWQAKEWIFDRFGSPEATQMTVLKNNLNLSENFETCLDSTESQQAIEKQALAGKDANVEGTPTVYVNGKKLPAGHFIPVLESLYRKLQAN